ncbi:MAG: TetR/AcrR family transcriptional regulator [Caulobacter sp.]
MKRTKTLGADVGADAVKADAQLAPRKQPTQARAKQSIERVLTATEAIIRRDGPAGVTTPAIAKESGVSVGSLYQYFPNKEAIILALYEYKLGHIRQFGRSLLDAPIGDDWREFFRDWIFRLRQEEQRIDYDISLNEAINYYPKLADVAASHVDLMADVVVRFLKDGGSSWPDEALFDLAVHAFYLNSAAWLYWSYAGQRLPQGTARLADTLIALLEPAFIDGPPPPPYAQRRKR